MLLSPCSHFILSCVTNLDPAAILLVLHELGCDRKVGAHVQQDIPLVVRLFFQFRPRGHISASRAVATASQWHRAQERRFAQFSTCSATGTRTGHSDNSSSSVGGRPARSDLCGILRPMRFSAALPRRSMARDASMWCYRVRWMQYVHSIGMCAPARTCRTSNPMSPQHFTT